jgi:CBS-domain-containing membrane protein
MKAASVAVPGKDPWSAELHDSALTVMTDFREHASVTVSESATIDCALDHMKHTGVRSAFVTDDQSLLVTGLITAYDIGSEKPMLHMRLQSIPRREVLVRDVMQPITEWRVANIEHVEAATVAAVSHMFAMSGLTHVPVVETSPGGGQRLRGMLSAARIKRVLSKYETAAGVDIALEAAQWNVPLGR